MKEKRSCKASEQTLSASFERRYLTYPKSSLVLETPDESASRFMENEAEKIHYPQKESLYSVELLDSPELSLNDENLVTPEKSNPVENSSSFEGLHIFKNQFFQVQEIPYPF